MPKTQTVDINISLEFRYYEDITKITSDKGICIISDTPGIKEATKLDVFETSDFATDFLKSKEKYPDFYISFNEIEADINRLLICISIKAMYHNILIL